jgi:hypothetical protein
MIPIAVTDMCPLKMNRNFSQQYEIGDKEGLSAKLIHCKTDYASSYDKNIPDYAVPIAFDRQIKHNNLFRVVFIMRSSYYHKDSGFVLMNL